MKNFFIPVFLVFIFSSCSSEDPAEVEVYNTEAFAYDIGDGSWEVNASTRVKGFKQEEENGKFTASLTYEVDLVPPSGKTIAGLISKSDDKSNNEKIMDTNLEAQFELDSTYEAGTYKVVFRVKDLLSGETGTSSADFKIGDDE